MKNLKNKIRFESTKNDVNLNEFFKTLAVISLPHLALLAIFLAYSCIGAAILQEIENTSLQNETFSSEMLTQNEDIEFYTLQSISNLVKKVQSNDNMTYDHIHKDILEHLNTFKSKLITNIHYLSLEGKTNDVWSFEKSLFFVVTTLSTIGDSGYFPISIISKLFLILYSIIGIPLVLILLHDIGRIITCFVKFLIIFISTLKKGEALTDALMTSFEETNDKFDFSLKTLIILIFFYLSMGASYYTYSFKWSFIDSIFYTFISISKVKMINSLYLNNLNSTIFLFFYYLFGISLFTLIFKYFAIRLRNLLLKNGRSLISNIINLTNYLTIINGINDNSMQFSFSNDSLSSTPEKQQHNNKDDESSTITSSFLLEKQRRKSILMRKRTSILHDLNNISLNVIKCDKQTQITTLLASKST